MVYYIVIEYQTAYKMFTELFLTIKIIFALKIYLITQQVFYLKLTFLLFLISYGYVGHNHIPLAISLQPNYYI